MAKTTTPPSVENAQELPTFTVDQIGQTAHVPPAQLLVTRNVREAKPDKALIDSVAELGVLEPIVAVLTDEGRLLVRFGERRTHAAIAAQTPTVPVYIASIDSLEKEAEIRRVIAQRDENTHRAGLSTAAEVGVVETLTGLGLSAAQVTKQARMKRADVNAALAVSGSKLARAAAAKYEALTLDQAALVAEFEDDPETVKALVVAAHEGNFDYAAQVARDERLIETRRREILTTLTEAGITVIDKPSHEDSTTRRLDRLMVSPSDRTRLEKTDHEQCPGHVAWVGTDWFDVDANGDPIVLPEKPDIEYPEDEEDQDAVDAYEAAWEEWRAECSRIRRHARRMTMPAAVYGCTGWRGHGHADPDASSGSGSKPKASELSEAERQEAKAARKLVVDNNKAWAASQPVRRAWLATFAKAKSAPKGTAAFLVTAFSRDAHCLTDAGGNQLAAELLGKKPGPYGRTDLTPAKSTTEPRALAVLLLQALAGYETALADNSWRQDGTNNAVGRYLRFLAANGYPLSDVEQYAASSKTA